jgi:hypothetical protein
MKPAGKLTVLYMHHCKRGSEGSVWLIPGDTEDFENAGIHITEYLERRGVLLKITQSELEEEALVQDIKKKFTVRGFEVDYEVTADD